MLSRHRGLDPLYLSFRLISLLLEQRHGDMGALADYARVAATKASNDKDFRKAAECFELAARCYQVMRAPDREAAARRESAESLVLDAELALTQSGRGALTAAALMSDAVSAMRQAPEGRERADQLHERLLELQRQSTSELKVVSTQIDVEDLQRRSIDAVTKSTLEEALHALCFLNNPPSIANLIQTVHKQSQKSIFESLFPSDVINSRGRVVARAPPLEAGSANPDDDGLRWRMFRQARLRRSVTAQAMLNPARSAIWLAHHPDALDLAAMIRYSPWIAPGHLESVLSALCAGFQGEFLVAGHIVPSQLEALIRQAVESSGGSTSMSEPKGIQVERTLASLLDTEGAAQALGVDQVFELRDLLVDPLGTNLRNEVAHGLMGDGDFFGEEVTYAWWLLLKFCLLTSKLASR